MSSRPHSVSPARLTSPGHPAEVPALPLALPPARRPGPPCRWEGQGSRSRMPRRCRRLSPRNCSSWARQRHPRCRPRWTSSRTWGQSGRLMLSLPCGLSPVSCEVGSGCPHFTDVDTEACLDHAASKGQSWDSKLQSMSQQMLPWGGESAHSPLRTSTNCRLFGPGLVWPPGLPSFLFMMDLRVPGGDQMRH